MSNKLFYPDGTPRNQMTDLTQEERRDGYKVLNTLWLMEDNKPVERVVVSISIEEKIKDIKSQRGLDEPIYEVVKYKSIKIAEKIVETKPRSYGSPKTIYANWRDLGAEEMIASSKTELMRMVFGI